MDDPTIRILIREKLKDGRLPHNSMPRFWGDPADGEICDACDKPITKQTPRGANRKSRLRSPVTRQI